MSESDSLVGSSSDAVEVLTGLVLRYLDGQCTAHEMTRLGEAIRSNASFREQFVQLCRMKGHLHELFGAKRAARQQKLAGVQAMALNGVEAVSVGPGGQHGTGEAKREAAPVPAPGSQPATPQEDPGSDTLILGLSAEDTIFPDPKPADK